MSEPIGHHSQLSNIAQWAAIVAVLLGQVRACMDDDRETVKTGQQVSDHKMRIESLEKERMQLGRIEEKVIAMDARQERFEKFVERQFDELNEKRKR